MLTRIALALVALGTLLGVNGGLALAQQPGSVMGTVERAADGRVWLTDGTSFGVTDQTSIVLVTRASAADLVPGEFVAITAQRVADGELEASIVSAFPEELRGIGEGQRLMDESNLMTNATIDDAVLDAVEGGELTVSFLGTNDHVHVTGATRVELFGLGSWTDVVPGAAVRGFVRDGVAGFLFVDEP